MCPVCSSRPRRSAPRRDLCLRVLAVIAGILVLGGCGNKGDLFLQEREPVEIEVPEPSAFPDNLEEDEDEDGQGNRRRSTDNESTNEL